VCRGLVAKPEGKSEDLGVYERIILKCILREEGRRVLDVLVCLRMGMNREGFLG
jgi:hypothetical protein